MSHFSKHKDALHQRLKNCTENFNPNDFQWIVKGDISGIQDFIFSVKSEKASKSLKGRSFFVQALSVLGIELLQKHLGKQHTEVFYNGGGNFFLLSKVPVSDAISKAREVIDVHCREEEIYLALTETSISKDSPFSKIWQSVNQQSGVDKLRKFQEDVLAFEAYDHKAWKDGQWQDSNGYEFDELSTELRSVKILPLKVGVKESGSKSVGYTGVSFFGHQVTMKGDVKLDDYVIGLPKWNERLRNEYATLVQTRKGTAKEDEQVETDNDTIIDFSFLADFAQERTGTDKLGVLKLDVDDLGKTFEGIQKWDAAKKVSAGLSWFFGEYISQLLDAPFANGKFSDNLYVVFSGGDDTFIVGAWDAVFEFSHVLHDNFEAFAADMSNIVGKQLTFSSSLSLIGSKFPVIRFAEAAEEALGNAKKWEDENGHKNKNRVSVFGQVLSWEEWTGARTLAHTIHDMIRKGETSRSIIERIKRVARQYENLSERAAAGHTPGPKVHRLFYTMRKWKSDKNAPQNEKSNRADFFEKEIKNFSNDLLDSFIKKKKMKYPKYPVAARWAEFMTRNQEIFTDQNIQ